MSNLNMSNITISLDLATRLREGLRELNDSASTQGCERPLAVVDVDKLDSFKAVFAPISRQIDEANTTQASNSQVGQVDSDRKKVVTFILGVHETSTYGAECPNFAALDVTQKMIKRLKDVTKIIDTNDFASCATYTSPDYWGPGNIAGELRLEGDEFVVTATGDVWFSSCPKHANYKVETEPVSIEFIEKQFEAAQHGDFCSVVDEKSTEIEFHEDALEMIGKELAVHGITVGESGPATVLPLIGVLPEVQLLMGDYLRHVRALAELESGEETNAPVMGE